MTNHATTPITRAIKRTATMRVLVEGIVVIKILPAVGLACAAVYSRRHSIGIPAGASVAVLSKIRQDAASYFPTLT
jgi:hypothetical protein